MLKADYVCYDKQTETARGSRVFNRFNEIERQKIEFCRHGKGIPFFLTRKKSIVLKTHTFKPSLS